MPEPDFDRIDFRAGDPVSASALQTLRNAVLSGISIRGSAGLAARRSLRGDIQVALVKSPANFVGKGKVAAGGITARTSDAAHGTGNVEVWIKDLTTGNYIDSGTAIPVDYISSTTGGLAAGVWVNFMYREDGGAEIVSVDCGN